MLLKEMGKEEKMVNIKARYMDTVLRITQEEGELSKDVLVKMYRELINHDLVKSGDISLESVEDLCQEIYEDIKVEDENENIYNLIEDLNTKVVRLVFMKKNGEMRVMWGTRNPEIVGKYSNKAIIVGLQDDYTSKDSVKAQVLGDYIKVLDLEKKEFRTFKPSNLVAGELNGIPTWVTCDINNDAWYKIVYDGENIEDYIEGNTLKQAEMSYGRRRSEMGAVLTAITNGVLLEDETEEDIKKIGKEVNKYITLYQNAVNQMELSEDYKDLVGGTDFTKGIGAMMNALKEEHPNLSIGNSPVSKKNGLYVMTIATDPIYVHPYYIVNARTGVVYLDRFGKMKRALEPLRTERVKTVKRIDNIVKRKIKEFIIELDLLNLSMTGGRVTKIDPRFVKRQERLELILKERNGQSKELLENLGVTLMPVKGTKTVRVNKVGTRDICAYVTPNILKLLVKDNGDFREILVVNAASSNSLLTDWDDSIRRFNTTINSNGNEQIVVFLESIRKLMVDKVLDLRVRRLFDII